MLVRGTGKDSSFQPKIPLRDLCISPRPDDTIFTADQHRAYYNDTTRRLRSTEKGSFSVHELHFFGKGTMGLLLAHA